MPPKPPDGVSGGEVGLSETVFVRDISIALNGKEGCIYIYN